MFRLSLKRTLRNKKNYFLVMVLMVCFAITLCAFMIADNFYLQVETDKKLNVSFRTIIPNKSLDEETRKELKEKTFKDCLEENKEKHENTIFYVTDEKEQSQYINLFKSEGIDAVLLPHNIDSPFISKVEQKHEGVKFLRIDTDLNAAFKEEVKEDDEEFKNTSKELTEIFKKNLNNDKLEIKVEKMKNEKVASMITVSEETRRMQDMMKMYSMGGMDPSIFGGTGETLVLNANHPLVQYVLSHKDGENTDKICQQLYDLASLSHGPLSPERMTAFVDRSNEIMLLLSGETKE